MVNQEELQQALWKKWSEGKARNSGYSLRAFAKKLDINSGILSQILNGKRKVSYKLATRLMNQLCLAPEECQEIMPLPKLPRQSIAPRYTELSGDQFRLIADWQHYAILSLINTKDFKSNTLWIAKRLSIPMAQVEQCLARLQRIGLVTKNRGQWKRSSTRVKSPDHIVSSALKLAHDNNLSLARTSLYRDDIHSRDFSSITMAIDPAKIVEAKAAVRRFQDELSDLLESGPERSEVYKMCFQLFPLTPKENSK